MLFSTVLSELGLVYIRPTVFISYTAMPVVCILFCSFCDHDMVTYLFSGPGKVLVLVLVLVLTKKSYLHHCVHQPGLFEVGLKKLGF